MSSIEIEDQQHFSPADLARREGVSVETVYAWNREGTSPPYMRIGRHIRYRLADILAWENQRVVARPGRRAAAAS